MSKKMPDQHQCASLILLFWQQSAFLAPMSLFGTTLQSLIHLESKTQHELAAASGVDASLISRMARGRAPSREQLGRLVAHISADPQRRLELLFAHLRDEAEAAGIADHDYVLCGAGNFPTGSLGSDLDLIAAECALHADVKAIITDMAQLLRRHRAAPGKLYPFSDTLLSAQVGESPPDDPPPATPPKKTPAPPPRRPGSAPAVPPAPGNDATG
jgi:transcriptional regulator with XRE-family HTH domain